MIITHLIILSLLSELLCWCTLFLFLTDTLTLARVCSEMSSYSTPGGVVFTITVAQKINQMFVIQTRGQYCTGGFALKLCAAAHYYFNKLGVEIGASQSTSNSLIANTQSLPVSPLSCPLLSSPFPVWKILPEALRKAVKRFQQLWM